jgi:hypothetical protein
MMDLCGVGSVQDRRGKQRRRFKRMPADGIEDQKPQGNNDCAYDSCYRSVDDDSRPRMLHRLSHLLHY